VGKQHAFGRRSLSALASCDKRLQALAEGVLDEVPFDLAVLEDGGYRGFKAQEAAFASKASRARFGQSPHNRFPSMAVDLVVIGPDGKVSWDWKYYHVLGAAMKKVSAALGLSTTWGGDWDKDGRTDDERLPDGPHVELDGWRALPAVDR
jgi:hypothetical protein